MSKIVVGVNFNQSSRNGDVSWGNKNYHYFAYGDIEVGDLVVVRVGETHKVVRVATVLSPEETSKANNYIIQKVDLEAYEKQQKLIEEKEALEAEYNNLISLEKELRELEDVVKNTDSPRLRELSKRKIEIIKDKLQ